MAHPVPRFYLYLAAAPVTIRQLIQRARARYRWETRPTTKRLRDEVASTLASRRSNHADHACRGISLTAQGSE